MVRDEEIGYCGGQGAQAFQYTFLFFIITAGLTLIMFIFLNDINIPIHNVTIGASSMTRLVDRPIPPPPTNCITANNCIERDIVATMPASFPVFGLAMLSLIGWVFFSIFAGIGLFALPLDLIAAYRTRPKVIKKSEYEKMLLDTGEKAKVLEEVGAKLLEHCEGKLDETRSEYLENKKLRSKFETNVYDLKKRYLFLETSYAKKGGNTITYHGQLLLGIVGFSMSICWLIHIFIFMIPLEPLHPFLNNLFIYLESAMPAFPLFGVAAFACYSIWLLWCCVKGNFRLGIGIPYIFRIFPMEVGNTMMNAFLLNSWLILVCAVPCVQFCAQAFPLYARNTSIDMIFGNQIQYLSFFAYIWRYNIFIYVLAGLGVLSGLLLAFNPRDTSAKIERELESILKTDGKEIELSNLN